MFSIYCVVNKDVSYFVCQELPGTRPTEASQKRPDLENRRKSEYHQDNFKPNKCLMTPQKLWELG